jgi:hypothetical protein
MFLVYSHCTSLETREPDNYSYLLIMPLCSVTGELSWSAETLSASQTTGAFMVYEVLHTALFFEALST